jgi:hypothetical protein
VTVNQEIMELPIETNILHQTFLWICTALTPMHPCYEIVNLPQAVKHFSPEDCYYSEIQGGYARIARHM